MTDNTANAAAAIFRAVKRFVSRTAVYFTFTTLFMYLVNRGVGAEADYINFSTVFSSFLVFAAVCGAVHFIFDTKLLFPVRLVIHATVSFGAFIVAFIVIPQKSENMAGGILLFTAVYAVAAAAVVIARAVISRRENAALDYENQIKR